MVDLKKQIDIIDSRNSYAKEIQSRADSDTFVYDDYVKETIVMAEACAYKDGYYRAKLLLMKRCSTLGNFESAYIKLEEIRNSIDVSTLSLLNQMAINSFLSIYACEYKKDLNEGIKYLKFEMVLAEKLGDINEIMRIKMNIGVISFDLGYLDSAIGFYKESFEYYDSVNDHVMLLYCCLNLGEAYFHKGRYSEAKKLINQAITYSEEEKEISIYHYCYHILAKVHVAELDYDQAVVTFHKAIEIQSELNNHRKDQDLFLDLIDLYIKMGAYKEALIYIKKIELVVINNVNSDPLHMLFYKDKAEVCEKLGYFEEAYRASKQYTQLLENDKEERSHQAINELIQVEHDKTVKRLETIAEVGRELTMLSDVNQVMLNVRKALLKVMPIDAIGVGELSDNLLCYNHFFDKDGQIDIGCRSLDDDSNIGTICINRNEEIIINDFDTEYSHYSSKEQPLRGNKNKKVYVRSLMYAPLRVNDEVFGVFTIQSNEINAFSSVEVNIFRIITDYVAISVKNVTQRTALERLSVQDNLTQMYNRRGIIDFFDHYLIVRTNHVKTIGIIMLDLDFFKRINDSYGHMAGDETLRHVGRVLLSLEDEDVKAGRLGGEEFALVFFNKDYQFVIDTSEKIRQHIEALSIVVNDAVINITTSVGATFSDCKLLSDYNQLYYEADHALYHAKAQGRNRVEIYGNYESEEKID